MICLNETFKIRSIIESKRLGISFSRALLSGELYFVFSFWSACSVSKMTVSINYWNSEINAPFEPWLGSNKNLFVVMPLEEFLKTFDTGEKLTLQIKETLFVRKWFPLSVIRSNNYLNAVSSLAPSLLRLTWLRCKNKCFAVCNKELAVWNCTVFFDAPVTHSVSTY